jgi:citrate lyase beta subunit
LFIYQFVKYNSNTNQEHLNKYSGTGAVICFDLEDSAYDWVNPGNSRNLKAEARTNLESVFRVAGQNAGKYKLAVRINADDKYEFEKDLEFLSGKYVHSVFLPKADCPETIYSLYNKLKNSEVTFEELLPVIETQKALINLPGIIKDSAEYFSKVVFGHCDYNMSISSLPFFHQQNNEYWKWVNRVIDVISEKNITFVNSVFLGLDNKEFFEKMLSHLHHICKGNFGQITLTSKQSGSCNNYNKAFTGFKKLIDDRSELTIPDNYPSDTIKNFEDGYKVKGSTVIVNDNILISPQEYLTCKNYLHSKNAEKQKLVFVGGCFPVQYNILFEDLFHQTLKRLYLSKHSVELNIKLLRYERFTDCLNKIRNYCDENKTDKLIFHVRPEPFFRLMKLYYKYKNGKGKIKSALNLPLFNVAMPEKLDVYETERNFPNYVSFNKSNLDKSLKTDFNYFAGILSGNMFNAISKYTGLVSGIIEYCKLKKIKLIVLGPPVRTLTRTEPLFCTFLNNQIKEFCKTKNISYIDTINEIRENKSFFDDTGKFATQEYHDFIALNILQKL